MTTILIIVAIITILGRWGRSYLGRPRCPYCQRRCRTRGVRAECPNSACRFSFIP